MVHFDKNEELMTSVTASEKIEITTVSDLLFANRIMEDSLVYQ